MVTASSSPTIGAAHDQPTVRPRLRSSRGCAVNATPKPSVLSSSPTPLVTVSSPGGISPSNVSRPSYVSVSGSITQGSAASHKASNLPPMSCTFVFAGFLSARLNAFARTSPSGPSCSGCVPNVLRWRTSSAARSATKAGVSTKRDAKRARPVVPSMLNRHSSPSPSSTCLNRCADDGAARSAGMRTHGFRSPRTPGHRAQNCPGRCERRCRAASAELYPQSPRRSRPARAKRRSMQTSTLP
jgi:hypothetical protein